VPYEDGAVQHVPREGVGMGDREEDGLKTSIRIAIATLLILSYDSTDLRDRTFYSIDISDRFLIVIPLVL
jgi:hypothetical protein